MCKVRNKIISELSYDILTDIGGIVGLDVAPKPFEGKDTKK